MNIKFTPIGRNLFTVTLAGKIVGKVKLAALTRRAVKRMSSRPFTLTVDTHELSPSYALADVRVKLD